MSWGSCTVDVAVVGAAGFVVVVAVVFAVAGCVVVVAVVFAVAGSVVVVAGSVMVVAVVGVVVSVVRYVSSGVFGSCFAAKVIRWRSLHKASVFIGEKLWSGSGVSPLVCASVRLDG